MSRCKCGRDIPPVVQTRSNQRTSVPETLRIQINIENPGKLVPGTAKLYCYWKISLYLDLAKTRIHLYVPPEWRLIEKERLDEWVGQLRDNPFEDIVLGQTSYEWHNDVLLPEGQSFLAVPIPGIMGWPNIEETVLYWDDPRDSQVKGRYLPIVINRRHILLNPGTERIISYWKTTLPMSGEEDRCVWVPPEWRRLPPRIRGQWKRRIAGRVNREIQLGGVTYIWYKNVIMPIGQNPELIRYQGKESYYNVKAEDCEEESEDNCEPLDLCTKPTLEDLEVAGYTLQALLEAFPEQLDSDESLRSLSEIAADLQAWEPSPKKIRGESPTE